MRKIGVCSECVVRKKDSLEKKLYSCSFCKRFFCHRHSKPKVVYIKDFKLKFKKEQTSTDRTWKVFMDEQSKMENRGHPCFQYTYHIFELIKMEERIERKPQKITIPPIKRMEPPLPIKNTKQPLPSKDTCPNCGSKRIQTLSYSQDSELLGCNDCNFRWEEESISSIWKRLKDRLKRKK